MKSDKTLIPIPLWVLKQKVETDFEEYMFFHTKDEELDKAEENRETFPLYDSTSQIITTLKEHGVEFDTSTGLWKE